jgi:hypothetical protein
VACNQARGAFVITSRKGDHDEHCTHGAAGPHQMWIGNREDRMFLVRDIMYCKPGQARPKGYHELVDHGRREIYSLEI